MKLNFRRIVTIGAFMATVVVYSANAAITIIGTRVIYPAQDREVTVQLTNEGNTPSLVQSWIDKGDLHESPEKIAVPFTLTPPMTRVEPHKGQSLRLIYTGEALPQDRETVFWLNVLDIPPAATSAADKNQLQIAVRTRIKIFFRPAKLDDVANTHDQISWTLATDQTGTAVLRATNASGHYLSLSKLSLAANGKTVNLDAEMIEPKSTRDFVFPVHTKVPDGQLSVNYQNVNDYGGTEEHIAPVQSK